MRVMGVVLAAGIGIALAQGPGYHEVANTGQLMQGMIEPASRAISEAAKDQGPQDRRAWRTVTINAIMLQESAQLLKTPGRAKDQDAWIKDADALADAGAAVQKAAAAQNVAALQSAANGIGATCQGCHSTYRQRRMPKKQ
jgi:cytochrome c556